MGYCAIGIFLLNRFDMVFTLRRMDRPDDLPARFTPDFVSQGA